MKESLNKMQITSVVSSEKPWRLKMPSEFRHVIRVVGADLNGDQPVVYSLMNIKGVGMRLADIIAKAAGINPDTRLGFISDSDVRKIEEIIADPTNYGVPEWLLDRKKDRETGKNLHLTGSDLIFKTKTDIDQLKKIRSWRGFRHSYGLKVRGQHTRTTGRSGKAMGVKKKQVRVS